MRPRPLKSPQDLGKLLDKFRTEKILERKRSREKSSIAKGLETLNRLIRKDSRAMPFFAESGEKRYVCGCRDMHFLIQNFFCCRKILIATTWRSGSTFLGTILNQIPMTFYSFEPLIESVLKNNTSTRANPVPPWKIVEAVMKCNFSNHDYGSKRTEWLIRKNSRFDLFRLQRGPNQCQRFHLLLQVLQGLHRPPFSARSRSLPRSTGFDHLLQKVPHQAHQDGQAEVQVDLAADGEAEGPDGDRALPGPEGDAKLEVIVR